MLNNRLTALLSRAFEAAGYDGALGATVKSQRPDLAQFQCNGAMGAAKTYKKNPFSICEEVIEKTLALPESETMIETIEAVRPGFINIILKDSYLAGYMNELLSDARAGVPVDEETKTIVLDYGGPNIAKPLHVGHLRTAIIGESLKRLFKFMGHRVIADVHLGDWGLQMGMIISEIERTHPELPYFDPDHQGDYPQQPPFSLSDLEEIYPRVSALSKEDPAVYEAAKVATYQLQHGNSGYLALWQHIVDISVADIKSSYDILGIHFDYWYGESTSDPYVAPVLSMLEKKGALYESDGAKVVDVTRPDDKKEIPPILLVKSDGSAIYGTTDLATLYQRMNDFHPDYVLYVVDSRQSTHFLQVFRCAQDHGIVPPEVSLEHIGFGTMNGKDGRPFKTRAGGILRLSDLIEMVESNAREKIQDRAGLDAGEIARIVGVATLKFADLSNYRMKDYVFDLEKFSSFEGKTGPYLLYTYVRVKHILIRLLATDMVAGAILPPSSAVERDLMLKINELPHAMALAAKDRAPNVITEYIYELATLLNSFYHTHHIMSEADTAKKRSWMAILELSLKIFDITLEILGIETPDKM